VAAAIAASYMNIGCARRRITVISDEKRHAITKWRTIILNENAERVIRVERSTGWFF
jgi:hypothetical protein